MHVMKKIGRITLAAFGWIWVFLGVIIAFLAVSEAVTDESAHVIPSYEKLDILPILEKEEWSEEDYDILYHQTGVGKAALDVLKGDNDYILEFQEALFYDGTLSHELAAFSTPHDYYEDFCAPLIPLQNGDVIVTSSCHTFGWRNGHAGLVVDATIKMTLESIAPGMNSCKAEASWFQSAANFIVLRLKDVSYEERAKIASDAAKNLYNVPYSITVGIFSSKDQGATPSATNCSHLVWQAYFNAGYDIDADGGPVCTARDIAMCELFEVVQVYGFDPDLLW